VVSYIFPLGGVILGVVFLKEPPTWNLALGAALIISSIAVVNWKPMKSSVISDQS
jgi:drug/metabolite transporter (DMT)-like permease